MLCWQEVSTAPTWFVDPLDGTTNFVHGYPFVAVSIGLTVDRVPVLGVIYNPLLDEMYWAVQGKVCDKQLPVSFFRILHLHDSIVIGVFRGWCCACRVAAVICWCACMRRALS